MDTLCLGVWSKIMCGRYVIDNDNDIVEMHKILNELRKHYSNTYEYNELKTGEIYPTDMVPVIIPDKGLTIDVVPMKWGFINPNNSAPVINARSEGILTRPFFKSSVKSRRCIIPTNGFFEWRKLPDRKEKYLIRRASEPMLYLAGIYNDFTEDKAFKKNIRFSIITRQSFGVISTIHDRMPVHVEKRDIYKWLNGNDRDIEEIFNGKIPNYSFYNAG